MEKLAKQIITSIPNPQGLNWPKNLLAKVASLLFAIFLWYFVSGEDKVDTNVFIPIEIVNLPRELVIANQFKKQLEVTISGPRGLISNIARQHITRTINLSEARPGTVEVKNDADSIPFSRGIDVLRIQPQHMTLLVDRLVERQLTILPAVSGEPPANYELVSVVLEPRTITLAGPQGVIGKETHLNTETIDITGLKQTAAKQVKLNMKPEIAELIGEPAVTAKIVIREKTEERHLTVPVISPLPAGSAADGIVVDPEIISVRAQIPVSLLRTDKDLRELFRASFTPADGASTDRPQKMEVMVTATTPEITIIDFSPRTVTIGPAAKERRPPPRKTQKQPN